MVEMIATARGNTKNMILHITAPQDPSRTFPDNIIVGTSS